MAKDTRAQKRKSRKMMEARRAALAAALPPPPADSRIDQGVGRVGKTSLTEAAAMQSEAKQQAGGGIRGFLASRVAFWGVLFLVIATIVGVGVALSAGLPILGHRLRIEWLLLAAVAGTAGGVAIYRRVGRLTFWQRIGAGAVGLLLAGSFAAGLLSNPVVVGGVVYPSTSDVFQQVRFAEGMRDDLLELGQMDKYLTSQTVEAWSRTDEIKTAKLRAEELGQKYRTLVDTDGLPAGQFGPAATGLVGAGYAMSKALEIRLGLLETQNDTQSAELKAARDTFLQQWQASGVELGNAASQLSIPLTVQGGPVE